MYANGKTGPVPWLRKAKWRTMTSLTLPRFFDKPASQNDHPNPG